MYILILLLLVLLAAFWGWRKGLFLMALHLLALLLAYSVAIKGAMPLAQVLTQKGWLNGMLVVPITGVVLLMLGMLLFSSAAKRVAALAPEEWRTKGKKSGALTGAAIGVVVGLLAVWMTGALQEAWQWRTTQQQPELVQAEETSPLDAALRKAAGTLMADGVEALLGNSPVTPMATQWVREPLSVGLALKHVAEQPALRSLFTDPHQYMVLLRGNAMATQQLPAFQSLVTDQQTMQLLQSVGLQGATTAEQSGALAAMLAKYAQRVETLRANPEFQALAADPALQQRIQQGNWLALLGDPRVRRLVAMLSNGGEHSSGTAAANAPSLETLSPSKPTQTRQVEEPVKTLYRWKDANGRLHITDHAPPEGVAADVIEH